MYATTSTEESVYIIGGTTASSQPSSVIAEYKNAEWFNIGSLQQSRYSHGAFTSGSWTMVIGGSSSGGQLVFSVIREQKSSFECTWIMVIQRQYRRMHRVSKGDHVCLVSQNMLVFGK